MVRLVHRFAGLRIARPAFADVGRAIVDVALLAGLVATVETVGARSLNDLTDLLLLIAVVLTLTLTSRAARRAWLPITAALGRGMTRLWRGLRAAAEPRFALAMRPTPGASAPIDGTLRPLIVVVAVLLVAALLLGPRFHAGLQALRGGVGATAALIVWGVWIVLLLAPTAAGALVLSKTGAATIGPRRRPWQVVTLLAAVSAIGVAALSCLPGLVAVAAVLWIGLGATWELHRLPAEPYRLCRRAADGTWRVISPTAYATRAMLAGTLLAALVTALGQADRLMVPALPRPPFALTSALGLLASAAALLLVGRLASWLLRVAGARGETPERPLVPTLWVLASPQEPEAPWHASARRGGWLVIRGTLPEGGFDLVDGVARHPRGVRPPPPGETDEETAFRLARRFHVVHRRAFRRGFSTLFKASRRAARAGGGGFLFAPHVRFLPGLLRDRDVGPRRAGTSAVPRLIGPPFTQVFGVRTRRYVASVLRDLEIDLIYFEDAVSWADLNRVVGVLFECYDQRRTPLEERWFRGLPRVRVVIHDEPAGDDDAIAASRVSTPPAMARTLVIVRDRGGDGADDPVSEPSDRRLAPSGLDAS